MPDKVETYMWCSDKLAVATSVELILVAKAALSDLSTDFCATVSEYRVMT